MPQIAVWSDAQPNLAQADGFLEGVVTDHGNGHAEVEMLSGEPLPDIVKRMDDRWKRAQMPGEPTFRLHVHYGPTFEGCALEAKPGIGIPFTYKVRTH